jgi:hypothetical protein
MASCREGVLKDQADGDFVVDVKNRSHFGWEG